MNGWVVGGVGRQVKAGPGGGHNVVSGWLAGCEGHMAQPAHMQVGAASTRAPYVQQTGA